MASLKNVYTKRRWGYIEWVREWERRYLLLTAECLLFFFTVVHKQIISYSLFTLVLLLLFNFDRCSFHVSSLHIFKKKVEEERRTKLLLLLFIVVNITKSKSSFSFLLFSKQSESKSSLKAMPNESFKSERIEKTTHVVAIRQQQQTKCHTKRRGEK